MTVFDDLGSLPPLPLHPGFLARSIDGDRLTLSVVEIDPGAELPEHHHPNEQLGIVLSGSLVFRVGDEEREVGPGWTWRIASDVPHKARAGPDGAVVIEVFSPARTDWRTLESGSPRPPRWPAA